MIEVPPLPRIYNGWNYINCNKSTLDLAWWWSSIFRVLSQLDLHASEGISVEAEEEDEGLSNEARGMTAPVKI